MAKSIFEELNDIIPEEDFEDEDSGMEGEEGVRKLLGYIKALKQILSGVDAMVGSEDVDEQSDAAQAEKFIRDAIIKLQNYTDDKYEQKSEVIDDEETE